MTLPHMARQRADGPRRRKALTVAAAAGFAVAIGYSVLIPILPTFIAALQPGQATSAFWVGVVTSAYAAAALPAAPILGAYGDRGHGPAIGAAMLLAAAFATAIAATSTSTEELAAWRFLAGLGAAGVGPYLQAWLAAGDAESDEWRIRRLVTVSMAATAGFLVGPLMGQAIADISRWTGMAEASALRMPFYAAALVLAAPATAFYLIPDFEAAPPQVSTKTRHQKSIFGLLALALVASAAIAAFEVSVSLTNDTSAMSGGMVYALLSLCTLVMFAAQAMLFKISGTPVQIGRILSPALFLVGGGLVLLGLVDRLAAHITATALIALGAGVVAPIVAGEISLRRPGSVGALVGIQSIFVSAGQALGALLAGALGALLAPEAVFVAVGGATLVVAAGYGVTNTFRAKDGSG